MNQNVVNKIELGFDGGVLNIVINPTGPFGWTSGWFMVTGKCNPITGTMTFDGGIARLVWLAYLADRSVREFSAEKAFTRRTCPDGNKCRKMSCTGEVILSKYPPAMVLLMTLMCEGPKLVRDILQSALEEGYTLERMLQLEEQMVEEEDDILNLVMSAFGVGFNNVSVIPVGGDLNMVIADTFRNPYALHDEDWGQSMVGGYLADDEPEELEDGFFDKDFDGAGIDPMDEDEDFDEPTDEELEEEEALAQDVFGSARGLLDLTDEELNQAEDQIVTDLNVSGGDNPTASEESGEESGSGVSDKASETGDEEEQRALEEALGMHEEDTDEEEAPESSTPSNSIPLIPRVDNTQVVDLRSNPDGSRRFEVTSTANNPCEVKLTRGFDPVYVEDWRTWAESNGKSMPAAHQPEPERPPEPESTISLSTNPDEEWEQWGNQLAEDLQKESSELVQVPVGKNDEDEQDKEVLLDQQPA